MTDYKKINPTSYVATVGGWLCVVGFLGSLLPVTLAGGAMLLGSPLIRKQLDSRRKHSIYRRKSFSLKSDLEQLNRRIALRKDFYLFLRPFELADSIGFSNQFDGKPKSLISFEEALSRSIDAGGKRTVFCVGDGKERWGVANSPARVRLVRGWIGPTSYRRRGRQALRQLCAASPSRCPPTVSRQASTLGARMSS